MGFVRLHLTSAQARGPPAAHQRADSGYQFERCGRLDRSYGTAHPTPTIRRLESAQDREESGSTKTKIAGNATARHKPHRSNPARNQGGRPRHSAMALGRRDSPNKIARSSQWRSFTQLADGCQLSSSLHAFREIQSGAFLEFCHGDLADPELIQHQNAAQVF